MLRRKKIYEERINIEKRYIIEKKQIWRENKYKKKIYYGEGIYYKKETYLEWRYIQGRTYIIRRIYREVRRNIHGKKYISKKEDIYSKKTIQNGIIQKKEKEYIRRGDICGVEIYTGGKTSLGEKIFLGRKTSLEGRTYTVRGLYGTKITQKKEKEHTQSRDIYGRGIYNKEIVWNRNYIKKEKTIHTKKRYTYSRDI